MKETKLEGGASWVNNHFFSQIENFNGTPVNANNETEIFMVVITLSDNI